MTFRLHKSLSLAVLMISFLGIGQQRIALELNLRKNKLSGGLLYHKVMKNNFIWSVGFNLGTDGRYTSYSFEDLKPVNVQNDHPHTAWEQVPQKINVNSEDYNLVYFEDQPASVFLQGGIGYFLNFTAEQGLRFHLLGFAGIGTNKLTTSFRKDEESRIVRKYAINHYTSGFSAELYHTLHIYKRLTFYYGIKAPFFLPLNRSVYSPDDFKYPLYGFEPRLSIGLTYAIGDC